MDAFVLDLGRVSHGNEGGAHPKQLKEVELDVHLRQRAEEVLPVRVLHILHDQAVRPRRRIVHDVHETDDVRPTGQIAQDLDFPLYLLLCDRLQDLDHARLFVERVDPLEDLAFRAVLARRSLNT